jgi:hypothetical protein
MVRNRTGDRAGEKPSDENGMERVLGKLKAKEGERKPF